MAAHVASHPPCPPPASPRSRSSNVFVGTKLAPVQKLFKRFPIAECGPPPELVRELGLAPGALSSSSASFGAASGFALASAGVRTRLPWRTRTLDTALWGGLGLATLDCNLMRLEPSFAPPHISTRSHPLCPLPHPVAHPHPRQQAIRFIWARCSPVVRTTCPRWDRDGASPSRPERVGDVSFSEATCSALAAACIYVCDASVCTTHAYVRRPTNALAAHQCFGGLRVREGTYMYTCVVCMQAGMRKGCGCCVLHGRGAHESPSLETPEPHLDTPR